MLHQGYNYEQQVGEIFRTEREKMGLLIISCNLRRLLENFTMVQLKHLKKNTPIKMPAQLRAIQLILRGSLRQQNLS